MNGRFLLIFILFVCFSCKFNKDRTTYLLTDDACLNWQLERMTGAVPELDMNVNTIIQFCKEGKGVIANDDSRTSMTWTKSGMLSDTLTLTWVDNAGQSYSFEVKELRGNELVLYQKNTPLNKAYLKEVYFTFRAVE